MDLCTRSLCAHLRRVRARPSNQLIRSTVPDTARVPLKRRLHLQEQRRSPLRPRASFRSVALVGLAGAALTITLNDNLRTECMYKAEIGQRVTRTSITALRVMRDFQTALKDLEHGSNEYKKGRDELNQRTADRILQLCLANGGMFTKLGQHLSSMNHALPVEYTATLAKLQDQAQAQPFSEVEKTLKESLAIDDLREVFVTVEPQPIAAASLAQVHKGKLKSGEEVAIKVQYAHLKEQVQADLWALRKLSKLVTYAFPEFDLQWILPEFENSLSKELDFEEEAQNGARVRSMFAEQADIYVPQVYDRFSSKRVLVMEYVHGVKANDLSSIRALGLDPLSVSQLVLKAFAEMIHCHGFVHCDPHPGNLLVRPFPSNVNEGSADGKEAKYSLSNSTQKKPQLVIVDHGLYLQLDEPLRLAYCEMWHALLTRDKRKLEEAAQAMGVGQYASAFSLVFTFKTMDSSSKTGDRLTKEERLQLRKKFNADKNENIRLVLDFLESVPRPLLLIFRIVSLVRSINKDLGGTTRNRLSVMGEAAVKGKIMERDERDGQFHLRPLSFLERLRYLEGTFGRECGDPTGQTARLVEKSHSESRAGDESKS